MHATISQIHENFVAGTVGAAGDAAWVTGALSLAAAEPRCAAPAADGESVRGSLALPAVGDM